MPAALEAVVNRMMAKRPEDRYASAEAVGEQLLGWSSGEADRPLDRRDDTGFRQAVAELEADSAWTDLADEAAPLAEEVNDSEIPVQPIEVSEPAQPPVKPAPLWLLYIVPLAILLFVALCAGAAWLAFWLWH